MWTTLNIQVLKVLYSCWLFLLRLKGYLPDRIYPDESRGITWIVVSLHIHARVSQERGRSILRLEENIAQEKKLQDILVTK